ncbi:MAG: PQQ-binding-like beta-propeller repeat protein, partial [Thermoplasmata archaeon]
MLAFSFQPMPGMASTDEASLLIDMGNGEYYWADMEIGENGTAINLTERAAEMLDLNIDVDWSEWGAFVNSIGDVECPVDGFWQFLEWDKEKETWVMSSVGASDMLLEDQDIIAFYCDPDYMDTSSPLPIPSPDHRYPSIMFRNAWENTGNAPGSAPSIGRLKWDYDTGESKIDSSPAVGYGKVFVTGFRGFYVLDEETGDLLWENTSITGQSSPTLYDGKVIVGGADGTVYSMDEETGEVLWSEFIQQRHIRQAITSSPKVWHNQVFIGTFNATGVTAWVYALRLEDGEKIWQYETESVYHSSPAIHDGVLYIGLAGRSVRDGSAFDPPYGVVSLNALNGSFLWQFEATGSVLSSPVVHEGIVYFTSKDGYLYSVNSNGELNWRVQIQESTSSPAILDGRLYVGTGVDWANPGKLVVYKLDGSFLWDYEVSGPVQSSPVIADGNVYFATNELEGKVLCLDATTGELVWSHQPSPESYILSSPVIADGNLFIGSDNGHIYAFSDPVVSGLDQDEAMMTIAGIGFIVLMVTGAAVWNLKSKKDRGKNE